MARLTMLRPRLALSDSRVAQVPPKRADPHYATPEHRRWRAGVIAEAGGRCQSPGCGRRAPRMFADHIIELQDGGAALDQANGQCLCGACHMKKTLQRKAERQGRFR